MKRQRLSQAWSREHGTGSGILRAKRKGQRAEPEIRGQREGKEISGFELRILDLKAIAVLRQDDGGTYSPKGNLHVLTILKTDYDLSVAAVSTTLSNIFSRPFISPSRSYTSIPRLFAGRIIAHDISIPQLAEMNADSGAPPMRVQFHGYSEKLRFG